MSNGKGCAIVLLCALQALTGCGEDSASQPAEVVHPFASIEPFDEGNAARYLYVGPISSVNPSTGEETRVRELIIAPSSDRALMLNQLLRDMEVTPIDSIEDASLRKNVWLPFKGVSRSVQPAFALCVLVLESDDQGRIVDGVIVSPGRGVLVYQDGEEVVRGASSVHWWYVLGLMRPEVSPAREGGYPGGAGEAR